MSHHIETIAQTLDETDLETARGGARPRETDAKLERAKPGKAELMSLEEIDDI